MPLSKAFACLFAAALLTWVCCKKTPLPTTVKYQSFRATWNGHTYTFDANQHVDTIVHGKPWLRIIEYDTISGYNILMYLDSFEPGTYRFFSNRKAVAIEIDSLAYYSGQSQSSGSITIANNDTINRVIEGTFGGRLYSLTLDTTQYIDVSNGAFIVKY